MINMIPHIVEHKHARSYELVVATSCLDVLLKTFQDFKMIVDYDSFESTNENIRNHEIWKANKRARINTLDNAAKATRNEWGHKLAECYRIAICKASFETKLERAILNWDIQVSYPYTHLATNLLITPSILILESERISRKISCYFV